MWITMDNVENPLDTGGRAFLYTVSTLHSGLYKACQRTFVSAAPDVKMRVVLGRPTIERNFKNAKILLYLKNIFITGGVGL